MEQQLLKDDIPDFSILKFEWSPHDHGNIRVVHIPTERTEEYKILDDDFINLLRQCSRQSHQPRELSQFASRNVNEEPRNAYQDTGPGPSTSKNDREDRFQSNPGDPYPRNVLYGNQRWGRGSRHGSGLQDSLGHHSSSQYHGNQGSRHKYGNRWYGKFKFS